jgi:hypothetical protein
MAADATTLAAYVKRRYDDTFVENALLSVSDATIRTVKKETNGSGKSWTWFCDVQDAFNASPDFATVQAAATNDAVTLGAQFESSWYKLSGDAVISAEIIGQTKDNDGAWMKAVDVAQTKAMAGLMHANAIMLQGKGWGEVSQITSVSGATFKPLIPSDITKYAAGMRLHFSSSLNTAGLRSSTSLRVTKVSYTPGQELVTCDQNLSVPGGVNNDWAFIAGARQDSATPTRLCPVGYGGWFIDQSSGSADMTDSTLTTLYGQDRTVNSRFYGNFVDATAGGSKLPYLIDLIQQCATIGNAKEVNLFCSYGNHAEITKDFMPNVRYADNPQEKSIGTGRTVIYSDGTCKGILNVSRTTNDNVIWGGDMNQIVMKSIGTAPHVDMEDGNRLLRVYNSQAYEIRWFQQMTFAFKNPAAGGRIKTG